MSEVLICVFASKVHLKLSNEVSSSMPKILNFCQGSVVDTRGVPLVSTKRSGAPEVQFPSAVLQIKSVSKINNLIVGITPLGISFTLG